MRPVYILNSIYVMPLMLVLTVPAAAQCISGKLALPKLSSLTLSDGEHVIASTETGRGKLEARVRIRGKAVSDPSYFLGEQRMKDTPESKIPKSLRACFRAQRDSISFSGYDLLARASEWLVPSAHAVNCGTQLVFWSCNDKERKCCAWARCGSPDHFVWAHACAAY